MCVCGRVGVGERVVGLSKKGCRRELGGNTPIQGLPVLLLLPYPSWALAILTLLIPDCLQHFKSWSVCIPAHEIFSPLPRVNLPSLTPDGDPTGIQYACCLLRAAFPDPLQKVQISSSEPQSHSSISSVPIQANSDDSCCAVREWALTQEGDETGSVGHRRVKPQIQVVWDQRKVIFTALTTASLVTHPPTYCDFGRGWLRLSSEFTQEWMQYIS